MSEEPRPGHLTTEYESLRAELAANRHLVFERPLAIALAGVIGAATIQTLAAAPFLALALGVVLWFNLWFTHNRLLSSARIIAYLHRAHDEWGRFPWLGWERALARSRNWSRANREVIGLIWRDAVARAGSDKMRYYGPILYFHLALAGISGSITLAVMLRSPSWQSVLCTAPALVALATFVCVSLSRFPTARIAASIEAEEEIWRRVRSLPESHSRPEPSAEATPTGS
jgi:hypothetical protein